MKGNHSVRFGIDGRLYRNSVVDPGNQAGSYQFRNSYTSAKEGTSGPRYGGDLAMLLLGIPTGGSIARNTSRYNQEMYGGVFVQDDWHVTPNLTLNLGLRYDIETGVTERENRNVRGFDLTSPSPLEPGAQAAYAKNPLPELPASQFSVKGGYLFLDQDNRTIWNADKNNIQPRVGFSYKLGSKTVVRGGVGIFYAPFNVDNAINQAGFSQSTSIPTTTDAGLTFPSTFADPFSRGILDPPGSSLGLVSYAGRDVDARPVDRKNARGTRFMLSVQRELPGGVLLEAAYVGNRGADLETSYSIDGTPAQYLSTSPLRDQATIDYLNQRFPNPFYGNPLIPSTESLVNTKELTRGRLLQPYPQFSNVTGYFYDGTTKYNGGQFRLEKRFHSDFSVLATYTYSKTTEKASKLNSTDAQYEERLQYDDTRHRASASVIWAPAVFKSTQGLSKQLLQGWSLQGIFTYQTGLLLPLRGNWNDRYFSGDLSTLRPDWDLSKYNPATGSVENIFPTSGFYLHDPSVQTNGADDLTKQRNDQRIQLSNHLRTLPTHIDSFRSQPRPLLDLSVIKKLFVTDRVNLQLRVEVFNVLNFVELANWSASDLDPKSASFGTTDEQSNLPREVQFGLKLIF